MDGTPICQTRCAWAEYQASARLHDCASCLDSQIEEGALHCDRCRHVFEIREGIPRLVLSAAMDDVRGRTARRFGVVWRRSAVESCPSQPADELHVDKVQSATGLDLGKSLVLDGGCGDGHDLARLAEQAREVIGIDLSEGGVEKSGLRVSGRANAHLIQADIARLPLTSGRFDSVYSYGVLHHTPDPWTGFKELARVLKPSAPLVIYLYEDFSQRGAVAQWLLKTVNLLRWVTVRLPGRILYALCWLGSPLVYGLCTVPARALNRWPRTAAWSSKIPYHHGLGPWRLTADLYDRFSAPIEKRYSRQAIVSWFERLGFSRIQCVPMRGWVGWGFKNDD